MLALIVLHLSAAALAPYLVRLFRRRAFLLLALAPAAAFGWLVAQAPQVTGAGAQPLWQSTRWVPALNLDLAFGLTTLTWVMAMLVTGVGALVMVYCAAYFRPGALGLRRFSTSFTAFAASMLGLVLADDLLLLYVFWELTTVFSYLLIGHNAERRANRRAALQALIVTTFGGLAMLVGIVLIGQRLGTYRIHEVVQQLPDQPHSPLLTTAVGLILLGALSKSALVPFHFWLPGAMAAPTPVSAYLHAAAMVKAGVYLVALLGPALVGYPPWRPALITLGVLTMLVGGLRALRQYDVKLLLAYGTVSQLGFLTVVVALGTPAAAVAGMAMIIAHALFKASLFMVVGIIDRTVGTRDLRRLTGLRRKMPMVIAIGALASASMAGLPPLIGFVAKESILTELWHQAETGAAIPRWAGLLALIGVALGSLLTAGYTARFLWGIGADKPGVLEPWLAQAAHAGPHAVEVPQPARGFAVPPGLLAVCGLVLGFCGPALTALLSPYPARFAADGATAHPPELALWHGLTPALLISLLALGGGVLLFAQRKRVSAHRFDLDWLPAAGHVYQMSVRGVDRLAVEVTARTQRGSLPGYLVMILLVVVALPESAVLRVDQWGELTWYDFPGQAVIAGLMAVAAVLAVRARQRIKALLLVSVTGYGTAMLFLVHGAPDLALTQVLVETVTLVVFLLVLRRLPAYFSDRPLLASRWWRVALGSLVGVAASGIAYVAAGARTLEPVSTAFAPEAVDFGGGKNIVNVTLVDIRAWDTMGEISVLAVAATGVASLIFLISGRQRRPQPERAIRASGAPSSWLRAGRTQAPQSRSVVFEIVTRLLFHTMIVYSVYLLFTGHNAPGGGFAAGLMAGLALMVRYLAGGRHELDDAAPVDAGVVLGLGLATATGSGLVPLLFGGHVLQSAIVDLHLPLLGDLHLVTSLFFDVGVYLVVVGLLLDLLRSLGGGIDAHDELSDDEPSDDPAASGEHPGEPAGAPSGESAHPAAVRP